MTENPKGLKRGECPFFDICGAAVIREHNLGQDWYRRFCYQNPKWYRKLCFLTDYTKCPHYHGRKSHSQ